MPDSHKILDTEFFEAGFGESPKIGDLWCYIIDVRHNLMVIKIVVDS